MAKIERKVFVHKKKFGLSSLRNRFFQQSRPSLSFRRIHGEIDLAQFADGYLEASGNPRPSLEGLRNSHVIGAFLLQKDTKEKLVGGWVLRSNWDWMSHKALFLEEVQMLSNNAPGQQERLQKVLRILSRIHQLSQKNQLTELGCVWLCIRSCTSFSQSRRFWCHLVDDVSKHANSVVSFSCGAVESKVEELYSPIVDERLISIQTKAQPNYPFTVCLSARSRFSVSFRWMNYFLGSQVSRFWKVRSRLSAPESFC